MVNSLSPFFTDEDLVDSLRLQFDYDGMFDMDFKTVFGQIEDIGDCYELKLRGRVFHIDYITAGITEVE